MFWSVLCDRSPKQDTGKRPRTQDYEVKEDHDGHDIKEITGFQNSGPECHDSNPECQDFSPTVKNARTSVQQSRMPGLQSRMSVPSLYLLSTAGHRRTGNMTARHGTLSVAKEGDEAV